MNMNQNMTANFWMTSIINFSTYGEEEYSVDGVTFRVGTNANICVGITGVACQEVNFFTNNVLTRTLPAISFAVKDLVRVREICGDDKEKFHAALRFFVGHEIGHQVEFHRAQLNGTFRQGMTPNESFADAYAIKASNGMIDETLYKNISHIMERMAGYYMEQVQIKEPLGKFLKKLDKWGNRAIFNLRKKQTLQHLSNETTLVTDETAFDQISKIVEFVEGVMPEAENKVS